MPHDLDQAIAEAHFVGGPPAPALLEVALGKLGEGRLAHEHMRDLDGHSPAGGPARAPCWAGSAKTVVAPCDRGRREDRLR
jgi:hypothetical protein